MGEGHPPRLLLASWLIVFGVLVFVPTAGGQVDQRRCGEREGPSRDPEKALVALAYTGRQQVKVGTLSTSNKESGGGVEQIWRANEGQRGRQGDR